MSKFLIVLFSALIAGCSSPPKPPTAGSGPRVPINVSPLGQAMPQQQGNQLDIYHAP